MCPSISVFTNRAVIRGRFEIYYRDLREITREFTQEEREEIDALTDMFSENTVIALKPMNIHYLCRLTEEEFETFAGEREDIEYEPIRLESYTQEEPFAAQVSCDYCGKNVFDKTTSAGYLL